MNFAQKLQNRRKEMGFSQEKLAFELNVSRQAVSKWESGQGYPEVEKLIQLSSLLELSLDELMKEPEEEPIHSAAFEEEEEDRDDEAWPESQVSRDTDSLIGRFACSTQRQDVERYLDLQDQFARSISRGVALILIGVMPCMWFDNDLGVCIMLIFIAVGVGLIVKGGMNHEDIDKLEKQGFHLSGELICDLQDSFDQHKKKFTMKVVTGVSLILIGVALSMMLEYFFGEQDAFFALMFPFIALAVSNFITGGINDDAYRKLLKITEE